jgi:hypothetical protein
MESRHLSVHRLLDVVVVAVATVIVELTSAVAV